MLVTDFCEIKLGSPRILIGHNLSSMGIKLWHTGLDMQEVVKFCHCCSQSCPSASCVESTEQQQLTLQCCTAAFFLKALPTEKNTSLPALRIG